MAFQKIERFEKTIKRITDAVEASDLAKHIESIYIFGSYAKGKSTSRSDLDVVYVLRESVKENDTVLRRSIMRFMGEIYDPDIDEVEIDCHAKLRKNLDKCNDMLSLVIRKDGIKIWPKTTSI